MVPKLGRLSVGSPMSGGSSSSCWQLGIPGWWPPASNREPEFVFRIHRAPANSRALNEAASRQRLIHESVTEGAV
jgi:hypothetical protein